MDLVERNLTETLKPGAKHHFLVTVTSHEKKRYLQNIIINYLSCIKKTITKDQKR